MTFRTELLPKISVLRFQRMQSVVDLDPPYQRESGIWKPEAQSLLIDSLINGLELPKLYFERATSRRVGPDGLTFQYAVIDGKQRLEAILGFIAGDVKLPDGFIFFDDDSIDAGNLSLRELAEKHPELASRFFEYQLPIVSVLSDSGDLIEEMFQRLNASSSLTAAERRNAVSGETRDAANTLADHPLLVDRTPIRNARYKYRELAAKFLAIEQQVTTDGRIKDTKANTLYDLFKATNVRPQKISNDEMREYLDLASAVLDRMANVFGTNDPLLGSIGTVVVYYIAFRNSNFANTVNREQLANFETQRRIASKMTEDSPDYDRTAFARLREYNAFVQSTNDGRALQRRADILTAFVAPNSGNDWLEQLDNLSDGDLPDSDDVEES